MSVAAPVAGWRTNAMQRSKNSHQSRQCRDCRFCGPSKRCLDPAIKSGRCGDWVWYIRGGKQCRRRYAWPKDPRTVAQLLSRGRFRAASKRYNRVLTDEQQDACIAAGAKVRSRPRLGQSGPLTGQQYWVRRDAAQENAAVKIKSLKTIPQVLQPQRVTRSTSGIHRGISGVSLEQRRLKARPARNGRGGRKNVERRMKKEEPAPQVLQNPRVTGTRRGPCRRPAGVTPSRAGRHSRTIPVPGRASVLASPSLSRSPASQGSRGRSPSRRSRAWSVRKSHRRKRSMSLSGPRRG
jgi:hypothetical protein